MAERVLTEMTGEWCQRVWRDCRNEVMMPPSLYLLDFARAVEAAVLARVAVREKYIVVKDGCYVETSSGEQIVTEREARKRERAAWDARNNLGRTVWRGRDYITRDQAWGIDATGIYERERDRLYPLPIKRVPRTVVLTGGEYAGWTLRPDATCATGWRLTGPHSSMTPVNVFSYIDTPADARLLADLVERPFDEVPDDS